MRERSTTTCQEDRRQLESATHRQANARRRPATKPLHTFAAAATEPNCTPASSVVNGPKSSDDPSGRMGAAEVCRCVQWLFLRAPRVCSCALYSQKERGACVFAGRTLVPACLVRFFSCRTLGPRLEPARAQEHDLDSVALVPACSWSRLVNKQSDMCRLFQSPQSCFFARDIADGARQVQEARLMKSDANFS